MLRIKRTYDPPARGDGRRTLVERLWPRGMEKEAVVADVWMNEVATSTQLRQWFSDQVERLRDYLVERQARRPRRGKREGEDDRRTDHRARRRAR